MSLSNLQLRKRYNRRIGKFLSKLSPIVYGFKYLKVADSDKVIEINVEDIVGWYKKDNRNELIFKGKIKPGNWPSNIRNKDLVLDKSEKYKSIKERFLQGYEWEETSIFKGRYKKKMEQYGHSAGLKILIEKAEEYRKYDRLFERIKKDNALKPPGNGITNQKELIHGMDIHPCLHGQCHPLPTDHPAYSPAESERGAVFGASGTRRLQSLPRYHGHPQTAPGDEYGPAL